MIARRARLYALLEDCADIKDISRTILVERAIQSNYELAAKVLGEIGGVVTNNVNNVLVASSDYLRTRAALIKVHLKNFDGIDEPIPSPDTDLTLGLSPGTWCQHEDFDSHG
jgi:hypothetical protein